MIIESLNRGKLELTKDKLSQLEDTGNDLWFIHLKDMKTGAVEGPEGYGCYDIPIYKVGDDSRNVKGSWNYGGAYYEHAMIGCCLFDEETFKKIIAAAGIKRS